MRSVTPHPCISSHLPWLLMLMAALAISGCLSAGKDEKTSSDEKAEPSYAYEEEEEEGWDEEPMAGAAAEPPGSYAGRTRRRSRSARPSSPDKARSADQSAEDDNAPQRQQRMIVYNAWLRLATHDLQETLTKAEAIVIERGGYVQSSTLTQRVLRVPSASYHSVLSALEALGEVRHKRQTSHDVTEEYLNIEARIENLKALRTRFEELLAKAETMEERLAIERELRRIAQELRVLEERRRYLADQASFATITLDVEPVAEKPVARSRRAQPFDWVSSYGLSPLFG